MIYDSRFDELEFRAEVVRALFSLKAKGLIKDFNVTDEGISVKCFDNHFSGDITRHLSAIPNFTAH
ncbi:MAG: hypothetical protein K2P99_01345 [Burkholderiales bacterium]|nr:hypothetical protein [Burkholderiales bacterium]